MGWDIKLFQEYLDCSDHLGGRLRILSEVTDFELSELYERAMFTIFPSFVEGFGLPVGESLAYGKPCICSDRASMPEVGGAFARYVNPDDVNEGYNLVRELIESPQELERWTNQVATSYKPKAWLQFSTEFFDAVTETSNANDPLRKCLIEAADIVGMGRAEVKRRDQLNLVLPYLGSTRRTGWNAVESWGCWTSSRRATLVFATRLPPYTEVAIYLSLLLPPATDSEKVSVKIDTGGMSSTIGNLRAEECWYIAEGKTGPDGDVSIMLLSTGPFARIDKREVFVGLGAVAYCESSDALARVKILEKITLEKLLRPSCIACNNTDKGSEMREAKTNEESRKNE